MCAGEHLKLGDFGIARHSVHKKGVSAGTMAAWMAPSEIRYGNVRAWAARDDIYHVGQLLSMLVCGSANRAIHVRDVNLLACSSETKEAIVRCIGRRNKRFENAAEMISYLKSKPRVLREGRITSLRGMNIVFTGTLGITRARATTLAERNGARVQSAVSGNTDLVVYGSPNPRNAAGKHGQKLVDLNMWRKRGASIRIIREVQFMKLV